MTRVRCSLARARPQVSAIGSPSRKGSFRQAPFIAAMARYNMNGFGASPRHSKLGGELDSTG